MSNKLKIAIVVLAIAVAVFVIYYVRKRKKQNTPVNNTVNGTSARIPAALPTDNDSFPLDEGSRGRNVLYLQRALNLIRPENDLLEDGVFGSRTKSALLLSVSAATARLPLDEQRFNQIIAAGNKAA